MHIISQPRQSGKTTQLIGMCRALPDAWLVVHSQYRAQDLRRQYPELASRIVPVHRLMDADVPRDTVLLFDELALCLGGLFNRRVLVATVTPHDQQ